MCSTIVILHALSSPPSTIYHTISPHVGEPYHIISDASISFGVIPVIPPLPANNPYRTKEKPERQFVR
jgi:hypothetical protein